MTVEQDIEYALSSDVEKLTPLSGGCVGVVYGVELTGGQRCVAKTGNIGCGLDIEGRMLSYFKIKSNLGVPDVLYSDQCLLVMSELPNDGHLTDITEVQAADQIAALHQISSDAYGLSFDTLIGGLHQPNNRCDSWVEFYGQHRLRYMANQAQQAGKLPNLFVERVEKLIGRLPELIDEPKHPSLLHGDLWGGNVMAKNGQLSGFIDPAIYYGHPEMDLAFSTLFNTFGDAFFGRYREHIEIAPNFFAERRDLYNLYPLLVHVRLFGGSYLGDVDRVLSKFGC